MIVEITHEEIDRALKKRTRNGDSNIPTQIKTQENMAYQVGELL
jgi:hypothetical protein